MTKTEMKLNVSYRIEPKLIIFLPSSSVTVVQYLTVYPIFHRFEWLYSHEVTPYIYLLLLCLFLCLFTILLLVWDVYGFAVGQ